MQDITEPTREKIEAIITSKNLDDLVGLQETSWFEFRDKHYATTSNEPGASIAKKELAKDCSSIANSGGGYIFIGLKTQIQSSQMTEYVESVVGINRAEVNLTSWRDSMKAALIPAFSLENIEHDFIDIDEEKSVLWMRIPSAQEIGLYPIMLHSDQVLIEGHKLRGKVIGVYERYGAENEPLSSEKVQSYIAQGIANESTGKPYSQDLSRLESKVDQLLNGGLANNAADNTEERRDHFLAEADEKVGDDGEGFFYCFAKPRTQLEFHNFWNSPNEQNSVAHLIKNPPKLRNMGWDLGVAMSENPTAELEVWEIRNGSRKILQVSETGEVFFAGTLRNFLGWGLDSEVAKAEGYAVLINEYAFTEYIAMASSFINKLVAKADNAPDGLKYDLYFGFKNLEGYAVGLNQPFMMGIESNGTTGPLRFPADLKLEGVSFEAPYDATGSLIQKLSRSGFGNTRDSPYLINNGGKLTFDESSYVR